MDSVTETGDGVQLGALSSRRVQQQFTGNSHAERLLQTQLRVVDGVRPQQMCDIVSPRHPVFPVLRLQRDAVSGSRGMPDPDFKLDPLLTHTLSQTHLTRLDALFVAVGDTSRAGALLLGEDDDVLVEEDVPHARPLPPSSPTHRQLALPHQLAALRHGDRTSDDEVTGPEVLAVTLGVSQDGEGGVRGGVYSSQLLQGLAVLLQSLSGSL